MENDEKVTESEVKTDSKKNNWWKYVVGIIVIAIIVLLLLHFCGNGKKYKITLHYGDETIEVDKNFKLSDLEIKGGKATFLVDSDGHIVKPDSKLDPEKEYSTHLVPDGKQTVKVTYKVDSESTVIEYQKGAGLLFPDDPVKKGYIFIAWKYEDIDDYPIYMMPVENDMVLVAVFEKSTEENGKCTLNCDTNNDGSCDLNCDTNSDGKPDSNIDTNGDGEADLNVDKDHDGICELNCDTNGDGKPDTNKDTNGDGIPDINNDVNGDGKCDYNCDTNNDGKCDLNCNEGVGLPIVDLSGSGTFSCHEIISHAKDIKAVRAWFDENYIFVSLTIDGKNIPESDFETLGNIRYYDYGKDYLGTGKTMDMDYRVIYTDSTNQKYYRIYKRHYYFEGNCGNNGNNSNNDKTISKELTYKCEDYENDGGFIFTSPVKKDQVKYTKVDGKEISTTTTNKNGYPTYDLSDYFDDGKIITVEVGYKNPDSNGNTKYIAKVTFPVCEFGETYYTLTLDPNGGKVSKASFDYIVGQIIYDLPIPTRSGYQFVGWYTKKSGGTLIEDTPMPSKNITVYAQWEKSEISNPDPDPEPPQDNGTIELSANKECIVKGKTMVVNATVNNALDSTITWTSDSCLTLTGSGSSRTVKDNGCTSNAKVTAKLNNGASSSITFSFEEGLTAVVKDYTNTIVTPDSSGYYSGVKEITVNVPSVISSTNNSIVNGESSSLRTTVGTYAGKDGIVSINTPCGQSKTIRWHAVIN